MRLKNLFHDYSKLKLTFHEQNMKTDIADRIFIFCTSGLPSRTSGLPLRTVGCPRARQVCPCARLVALAHGWLPSRTVGCPCARQVCPCARRVCPCARRAPKSLSIFGRQSDFQILTSGNCCILHSGSASDLFLFMRQKPMSEIVLFPLTGLFRIMSNPLSSKET